MTANAVDLTAIDRIVGAVPGVQQAAAMVDLRLRHAGGTESVQEERTAGGVPVGDEVPAIVHGAQPSVPHDAVRTLPEALLRAAAHVPGRGTTFVRLDAGTDRQTYAELLHESSLLLGRLRRLGLQPGDAVLVYHDDNRGFVTTWWACVLGGFVPTPVGPAREYSSDNATLRKLRAAWDLLGRPVIVTDEDLRSRVAGLAGQWGVGDALRVTSPQALGAPANDDNVEPHLASPDDPALNLLTSGSTGTPKCVHHTHRSLIARTYATIDANGFTGDDIALNWMPLDHVGGMVMFNLRDVVLGCEHVNAPTEMVIRRPLSWLDLVDRFRITNTWAPNFAYSMVTQRADEIAAGAWDLSSLRNICNAGEAVVPRTALRFVELLTPHGLPADAMVPCWGMSETSSGVTYSRMDVRDAAVGTVSVDAATLEERLIEYPAGSPRTVMLCEVGAPIAGVSLRIVDEHGAVLPEGHVGRLHVAGTTILAEYLRNEAANAASFTSDGWFDTGDLGFLRHGRLFLTGRKKHMVIVNGVNYPAHEVEAVVERVPGVRPACTAVCATRSAGDETEAIVVFFVLAENAAGELDRVLTDIAAALAADLGLRAKWLVPIDEADFPRQQGGKVQRERLTDGLTDGRFSEQMYPGDVTAAGRGGEEALLESSWGAAKSEPVTSPPRSILLYLPAGSPLPLDDPELAVISASDGFRVHGERHVEADLTDAGQQDRALAHLFPAGAPDHVIYAVETGRAIDDDPSCPSARLLTVLARLARVLPKCDLTVLVSETLGARPQDRVQPARGSLPALVRTAVAEGMLTSIRLIDAPHAAGLATQPRSLPRFREDVVAMRDGSAVTPRLRRVPVSDRFDVPARFLPPGGVVMVTGGLGGLGRLVAEHLLVAAGARVLIVGTTPQDALGRTGRDEVLAQLRALGEVRYAAADVADADALAEAVMAAERDWGRGLSLIVHCAGAAVRSQWNRLSAHRMDQESVTWLRAMLRPKLHGAMSLDRLLADRPNAAAVLYSSVNGFLGGSGFGAYSAANATLDTFAHEWASRGHSVRCIAWSMWAGPGMNDGSPLVSAAQRRGLRLIAPSEGLTLLLSALHHDAVSVLAGVDAQNPYVKAHLAAEEFEGGGVVVAVVPAVGAEPDHVRRDVGAALAGHGLFARVVVLHQLPTDAGGGVDPVAVLAAGDIRMTSYQPPQGPIEELLARLAAEVLGVEQVGRDDSFFGLGCDSVRAVQLAEHLGAGLECDIPVGLLYEQPTVRGLAAAAGTASPRR